MVRDVEDLEAVDLAEDEVIGDFLEEEIETEAEVEVEADLVEGEIVEEEVSEAVLIEVLEEGKKEVLAEEVRAQEAEAGIFIDEGEVYTRIIQKSEDSLDFFLFEFSI